MVATSMTHSRPLAAPAIPVVKPFTDTWALPRLALSPIGRWRIEACFLLATDMCTARGLGTLAARGQLRPGGWRQCAVVRSRFGLPALAFTEHLDLTGWVIDPEDLLDHLRPLVGDNGLLIPEPLDVAGYLEIVERCRRQFPELRILSGVEFGQPHIDADKARQLVTSTKPWQWPSTSASTMAVSRRTLDPLTVPGGRSAYASPVQQPIRAQVGISPRDMSTQRNESPSPGSNA